MYHQHFEQCPSTQAYLKDNWGTLSQMDQKVLISTDHQTAGVGRRGNTWMDFTHSIAFSFSLEPSKEFTLTSLELGVLICEFFPGKINLKWPNDLLNSSNKKCGGIICNVQDKNIIIAGVGLNLYIETTPQNDFKMEPGGILKDAPKSESFKKDLPATIVEYIHNNRLENKEIVEKWNSLCGHLNMPVKIIDQGTETKGKFVGIDPNGSALLEIGDGLINIISGSLFFE